MLRKRWQPAAVLLLVVTLLGVLAGTAASTPNKSTVKVGIIYSKTGALSGFGAEYIQGFQLGMKYLTNGTNKVNGHKVQITMVDDGTDASKAVAAGKDLIGQGYKILA